MKKILLVSIIVSAVIFWLSSVATLDPSLLRKAEMEWHHNQGRLHNKRYLTIIDYRLNILQKRLWVIDMQRHTVVLNSRVSHALRSGFLYPTRFSNQDGSELSSPGTFLTGERYIGRFGEAMRLDGITPGVNTQARARAIVFHVDPGYRYSKACFMTSEEVNARLIPLIEGKSLVLVYR